MDKTIKVVTLAEAIKDMNEEELERFKKERYEKFIRPLMRMNIEELKKFNVEKREEYSN